MSLCRHRGSGASKGRGRSVRENTVLSFQKAATSLVDFIEFDVHVTAVRSAARSSIPHVVHVNWVAILCNMVLKCSLAGGGLSCCCMMFTCKAGLPLISGARSVCLSARSFSDVCMSVFLFL